MTQAIEKSFLIDPLTTNNAIYPDSLTLIKMHLSPISHSPKKFKQYQINRPTLTYQEREVIMYIYINWGECKLCTIANSGAMVRQTHPSFGKQRKRNKGNKHWFVISVYFPPLLVAKEVCWIVLAGWIVI